MRRSWESRVEKRRSERGGERDGERERERKKEGEREGRGWRRGGEKKWGGGGVKGREREKTRIETERKRI